MTEQVFASVVQKMDSALRDRDSDIRELLGRIVRAVAKDTVNDILENEAEIAEKAAVYARRIFAGEFEWKDVPGVGKAVEVAE